MQESEIIRRMREQPPAILAAAARAAAESGREAHLVGGALRDLLLGRVPLDFDVIVERDAAETAERAARLCNGRTVQINRRFSTVRVVRGADEPVDLLDRAGTLEQDLAGRDFTANSLAWRISPDWGAELIDLFEGRADALAGLVRAVGPASVSDQPIRALRAFRLLSVLGPNARIESATLQQIGAAAAGLAVDPGETVGRELSGALIMSGLSGRLEQMQQGGVLKAVLPEALADLSAGLSRARGLERLAADQRLPATWAAYIEPRQHVLALACFRSLAGSAGAAALNRLRRPRAEARLLTDLVAGTIALAERPDRAALRRLAFDLGLECRGAALIVAAQTPEPLALIEMLDQELPLGQGVRERPLLSGADLLELGVEPGPHLGRLLLRLDEQRLAQPGLSRDQALELVRGWIAEQP